MGIKACCWLFLFLTVCRPVTFTDEIAAANAIVPFRGKEVERGFCHLYDTIADKFRPLSESLTEVVKGYIEKRQEWNIWNVIFSVIDAANIAVCMDAAISMYSDGFDVEAFLRLLSASVWPILEIPLEEKISPAVLQFDKMYLTTFWRYLNLRKEEKAPLPPPEESLVDKMANRILPGTNMKNLLNYLKKMLKNIPERIGTVLILVLSLVTIRLLTQVCLKDKEYDSTRDFDDTLCEWLTPTGHGECIVEDDDIMDARVSTGSESDESDYWLSS